MSVLEITRHGTTAVLTMNRPEVRNAFNDDVRDALVEALPTLRDDASVRAVVLTGAGGHFCAGGDVRSIKNWGDSNDLFEARKRLLAAQRWFDQLVDFEKPVIAAVDGVAYGAGLSLALAADFVFVSSSATFCAVFARIGYVPDMGGMYLLPRAVGLAKAKELAFSARPIRAQEAVQLGLAQRLVDEGAVLDAAVEFAGRFAHAPAGALGLMKSVMNRAFESSRNDVYVQEAMAQQLCRQSDFHKDAIRRFLAKEAPLYQWPEEPR